MCPVPERVGLSPGPVPGGHPDGGLLLHGSAVVRGRHRHLHRSHRQPEDGDGDVGSWRAAQVPGCEVRLIFIQMLCVHRLDPNEEKDLLLSFWGVEGPGPLSSHTHTHTHTHMAQQCVWASVSCPRTPGHTDTGIDLVVSGQPALPPDAGVCSGLMVSSGEVDELSLLSLTKGEITHSTYLTYSVYTCRPVFPPRAS